MLVGPVLLMLRSGFGSPPPVPPLTSTDTLPVVVKVCADLVPVTEAVLLSVVPSAAVTWPRMVTVQTAPPLSVPASQVTTLPLGPPWEQLPLELVIVSCGTAGGVWITPTPLTWSVITTLLTLEPPVLVTVIV